MRQQSLINVVNKQHSTTMMYRINTFKTISAGKKVKIGSSWYLTQQEALAAQKAINSFKEGTRVGQFRENGPIVKKTLGGHYASNPVKDDRY